ncbi:Uncharacterised protein r2_g182 [Pycnogonum litorale]
MDKVSRMVKISVIFFVIVLIENGLTWETRAEALERRNRHMKTSLSQLSYLIKLRKQESEKNRQDIANYTYKANAHDLNDSELCREARLVKCMLKLERRLKSRKGSNRKISFKTKCNAKEKFYKCVEKMHKRKCRNQSAMLKMASLYKTAQHKLKRFLLSLRGCSLGVPAQ